MPTRHLPDAVPDIEPVIVNMINFIAVTPTRYKQFQECTADELNELQAMVLKGWPDTKQETLHAIRMYYMCIWFDSKENISLQEREM